MHKLKVVQKIKTQTGILFITKGDSEGRCASFMRKEVINGSIHYKTKVMKELETNY